MLISDSKKFVFIHISKTAGSSIRAALEPYAIARPAKQYSLLRYFGLPKDYHNYRFRLHAYLDMAEKKLPSQIYQNYTKFAIVRNPWDRLVSAYSGYYMQLPGEKKKKSMTFFEFLQRQRLRENYQVRRIINQRGEIDLDFMGRFEQLEEDSIKLGKLLDIRIELPHINKSVNRKSDYRDHYDDKSYNYVCENWSKDIKLLGYKFE